MKQLEETRIQFQSAALERDLVWLLAFFLCHAASSTFASNHTVTSVADSGAGTLRAALASASDGDTINFSLPLPATITLTSGTLVVNNGVAINGPGAQNLAISGNSSDRVFLITAGNASVPVSVSGLTIRDGYTVASLPMNPGGGGIYSVNGSLTIADCVISNNRAVTGAVQVFGGGICLGHGSATLLRCALIGNSVSSANQNDPVQVNGSAIARYGAAYSTSLINCTVANNVISNVLFYFDPTNNCNDLHGAISCNNGQWVLSSCTVASNIVAGVGVGCSGTAVLSNSIVAFNFKAGFPNQVEADVSGPVTSLGHNLIKSTAGSSGWNSTDILLSNPLLGPLQDNGGSTPTMALLPGSPAIDAGNSGGVGTDQRGRLRPADHNTIANRAGGDGSDIGAYEVEFTLTTSVVGSGSVSRSLVLPDYDPNTIVALTAVAACGSRFTGWSGDASGANDPLSVTMTNDLLVTANFDPLPCTCIRPGLVSWWRAEGDASDAQANYPGTLTNGMGFAPGKVGQAFSFNGTNQYADFGTNIGNFGSSDFTVEFWMKSTSARGDEHIMGKRPVCSHSSFWNIILDANGKLEAEVDQDSAGVNYNGFTSTRKVNDGAWHHVAMVRQGDELTCFIDGTFDVTTFGPGVASISNSGSMTVGKTKCSESPLAYYFTGMLDEISLYNRGLAESEIQEIYNAGSAGKCLPICTPAPSGLVSWWPGAGNGNDVMGNNNGTPQNNLAFVAGKVGTAFSFDGTDDLLSIGGAAVTPPWTAEMWIQRQDRPAVAASLLADSTGWGLKLEQYPSTKKVGISSYGGATDYTFNYTAPVGIWTHLAFVGDSANTQLYVNGAYQDTIAAGISLPLAQLGVLKGSVDEVSVYSRLLSATEIQSIYNAGSAGKCLSPVYITNVSRSGNSVNLTWLSQKGLTYRVQYKTSASAGTWTDVSGDVTATGSSSSKTDSGVGSDAQRFYRVVMFR